MFSGIIQRVATLSERKQSPKGGASLSFSYDAFTKLQVGSSVACGGVCLTVEQQHPKGFRASASEHTLSHSNLGTRPVGDDINLEPALRLGDEISGHWTFGHVDHVVETLALESQGDSMLASFKMPSQSKHLLAQRGSVALEGVSLTVADVAEDAFRVVIVPHTLKTTSFRSLKVGYKLNMECDMLARYVATQLEAKN